MDDCTSSMYHKEKRKKMTEQRKVHRLEDCETCKQKKYKWFTELVPHMSESIDKTRDFMEELLTDEEIEYIKKFVSGMNADQMHAFINLTIEICQDYILDSIRTNLIEDLSHLGTDYIVQEGNNDTSLN